MDDCIFCKIIKGVIPCSKVYEDEKVLAFMDINPTNKGHVLVVPKKHEINLLESASEDISACFDAVKKVAPAMMKGIPAKGFNIVVNTNKEAGQEVMHTHIHIIPRHENDNLGKWEHHPYQEGEMEIFRQKITEKIQ